VNRRDIAERKFDVMNAAADRWKAKAPDVAEAARRLAAGGPRAASSPERYVTFMARETLKRAAVAVALGFERKIGPTFDLDDIPPDKAARDAGRPVAMIVELLQTNRVGEGFATGFVVAPGLLITNWHVFAQPADTIGSGALFGFERNDAGLIEPGVAFELDAQSFFLSDKTLDIAIVGLKQSALAGSGALPDFGRVRLIPSQGKILIGHSVSVIQHPDGRHKHWGVRENKLVVEPKEDDLFISYTTDTLGGSSGSPAFNHDWELVAVHHSGVPRKEGGRILTKTGTEWRPGMPDTDVDWVANEGARVSRIYRYLKDLTLPVPAQQALLNALLSESTDPVLTGEKIVKPVTAAVPTPAENEAGMNITVNGTANFYIGRQPQAAAVPQPRAIDVAATPILGAEKKLIYDPDYDHRPGYQSGFLDGFHVPTPSAPLNEVLKEGNGEHVLRYHHYSLVMHKKRRLAMWTASNIDYDEDKRRKSREDFGSDSWKPDPRIVIQQQIEDTEFYEPARKFDRGHLVRRDDVAWGKTEQEEEYGNSDSFHWTNCTPQHEGFNRDMFEYHGLWGELEHHIAQQAGFVENLLILFAGPVLAANDPKRDFGSGIKVQVPIVFWKVVVTVDDTGPQPVLRALGFLLDQTAAIEEFGWEGRFKAGKFKEQQVSLRDITDRARVKFDDILHSADPLANVPTESRTRSLMSLDDLVLR
jgi:endonuclease G